MLDFYIICPSGVTKSIVGEITDSSNQAEAFALTFVVYGVGATVGYDCRVRPPAKSPFSTEYEGD